MVEEERIGINSLPLSNYSDSIGLEQWLLTTVTMVAPVQMPQCNCPVQMPQCKYKWYWVGKLSLFLPWYAGFPTRLPGW